MMKSNRPRKAEECEKQFCRLFSSLARYHHRHEVFRDFIFMSAAALHNHGAYKDNNREKEFEDTSKRYKPEDRPVFRALLELVIDGLGDRPRDMLGPIYMDLGLGNKHTGQFFTPDALCRLNAALIIGNVEHRLQTKATINIDEPATGSGGMILAAAEQVLEQGYNPANVLRIRATDVDRTAALMSYIQFALWNIPAEVIVGNTLTLEVNERWMTPALANPFWRLPPSFVNGPEACKGTDDTPSP